MTDITDHTAGIREAWERGVSGPLAEFLTAFARGVAARPDSYSDDLVNAARYILATVDAPEPNLAEELANITKHWKEWTTKTITAALAAAADRAKHMEHDLAESCDEVERLTAERDRLEAAQHLSDGSAWGGPVREPTVESNAESNAETPDPADVQPGEAWIVEVNGERRTAVKDRGGVEPWNTVPAGGRFYPEENAAITLVSRLVPAPRVITNPDELKQLAATSIIRDGRGWPGGITDQGVTMVNGLCVSDEEVLSHGPVTVLWEPEA